MPDYLIHIGPHKTGTTYLQVCFQSRRAELAARGIAFPAVWQMSDRIPSQIRLKHRLAAGEHDQLRRELDEVNAPGTRLVLLSSEDLSTLDEATWAAFRDILGPDARVRIVFYLRAWSASVPSAWQESIKHGHATTIPEYLYSVFRNPEVSPLLNWDRKLEPVARVFGREAIHLVSYSLLGERKTDLFKHFAARFLDWPNAEPPALGRPNSSRDPVSIELLRVLNMLHRERGNQPTAALRLALDRSDLKEDLAPARDAIARRMTQLPFSDEFPPLQSLHVRLFESWADRVTAPCPPARLFPPRSVKLSHATTEYLLDPGVGRAIRTAYRTLAAALEPTQRAQA